MSLKTVWTRHVYYFTGPPRANPSRERYLPIQKLYEQLWVYCDSTRRADYDHLGHFTEWQAKAGARGPWSWKYFGSVVKIFWLNLKITEKSIMILHLTKKYILLNVVTFSLFTTDLVASSRFFDQRVAKLIETQKFYQQSLFVSLWIIFLFD